MSMYAIFTNTATYSTKPVPSNPRVMTKERDNLPGQPRRHLKLEIGKKNTPKIYIKKQTTKIFAVMYHNYNLFTYYIYTYF